MSRVLTLAESGAVIGVMPARASLRVHGPDARSWLNGLVTCDVSSVQGRRGAFGLLLSKQGKVQTELDIVDGAGDLLLGLPAAELTAIHESLERYLVMEDAELSAEPELAWLRLFGPRAEAAISAMPAALAAGALEGLGVPVFAVALRQAELDAQIASALAALGDSVALATEAEARLLRIAQALPAFAVDYGSDDNPHEAALDRRAVAWNKGCYLGQEVVCMQDMRGRVKRRLTRIAVEGAEPVPVGAEVSVEGEAAAIGRITSAERNGDSTWALAMLKAPFFERNDALAVAGRAARILTPTAAA
jgi:folate-binding protein YgfZ